MRFIRVLKSRNGKRIDFEKIEPEMEKIAKRFDILLIYLYGSYATNSAGKLSDLDIAFLPAREFDLDNTLDLLDDLQDTFEEEAIDLINLNQVPLILIHRVFKEGRCLYAHDLRTRIEFEVRKEHLYYDTAPLRKLYFNALKRRIQNGTYGYR